METCQEVWIEIKDFSQISTSRLIIEKTNWGRKSLQDTIFIRKKVNPESHNRKMKIEISIFN